MYCLWDFSKISFINEITLSNFEKYSNSKNGVLPSLISRFHRNFVPKISSSFKKLVFGVIFQKCCLLYIPVYLVVLCFRLEGLGFDGRGSTSDQRPINVSRTFQGISFILFHKIPFGGYPPITSVFVLCHIYMGKWKKEIWRASLSFCFAVCYFVIL